MGTKLSELISGLLDEIAPRKEFSPEFTVRHAEDAHALLQETAGRVKALPNANAAGLFPRISVAEVGDLGILAEALDAYGEARHVELLNAVRAYALGSDEFTLEELEWLADAYVSGARLSKALLGEVKRHKNGGWRGDAVSPYPTEAPKYTEYAAGELADLGNQWDTVTEPLAQGRKINAIKALRERTNCSLLAAKNAVEEIQRRWDVDKNQPAPLADWERELLNGPDQN